MLLQTPMVNYILSRYKNCLYIIKIYKHNMKKKVCIYTHIHMFVYFIFYIKIISFLNIYIYIYKSLYIYIFTTFLHIFKKIENYLFSILSVTSFFFYPSLFLFIPLSLLNPNTPLPYFSFPSFLFSCSLFIPISIKYNSLYKKNLFLV